jgi:hypothetical protein
MAELKPMEVGEVLDGTFTLYGRHFKLFLTLSVAVMWLPVSVQIYLRLHFSGVGPEQIFGSFQDHVASTLLLGLAWLVASTIAGLLLTAGSIHIISASYLGRQPSLREALSLGASRILQLFLVALGKWLLLGLIVMVGSVAMGIAAALGKAMAGLSVLLIIALAVALVWFLLFVICGYGVTTPIVVLENLDSSFDAFGRSWELTRTFKLKVLGLGVIAWLIAYLVPSMALGAIGGYVIISMPSLQSVVVIVTSIVPIAVAPVMPCVFTLLYYDLRVRREAFDLQVLGQQLGIT